MPKSSYLVGGLIAAALCLVSAEARAAVPQAAGAKFRPSNCTNCRQVAPSVAGAGAGGFMVAWEGSSPADSQGIVRRLFNATAVGQGGDTQVNTDPQLEQAQAAAAVNAAGNYVVVWSTTTTGNVVNRDILGRRFRPNGTPLGAVFKVSADDPAAPVPAQDTAPAIATTPDGGFVVVWIRVVPPGSNTPGGLPEVYMRRYNSSGVAPKAPLKISTGLASGDRPDVCVDSSNQVVAVWPTIDQFRPFESNLAGVAARRIALAGTPTGPEIVVAPANDDTRTEPAVSCGKGNTFVVVWQTTKAPAQEGTDIVGLRFSRLGRAVGTKFRVNTQTSRFQKAPAISHDPAGNFIVVWETDPATGAGIRGRRFNTNAVATSDEFVVDSVAEGARKPAAPDVAHTGSAGNFVVVWQDGSEKLYAQRYTP